MDKHGERDEKRRHRLSLLGIQSDRSDDSSDDGREDTFHDDDNHQNVTASASLAISSQAGTSQRAEKQASRPSMFSMRSSFLVGGETKRRFSNVARMPSRRSIVSDVESGSILPEKQPRQRNSVAGSLQRNESQMSIPGAFRVHANGIVDDDPTVASLNTKDTNPFVIDHASLIENPNLHAHLASGGAIPTEHPYTNGATGGPTPVYGSYAMPSYGLNRVTTPQAMPSLSSASPIGVVEPVLTRRNQDGLTMNRRQIRLMFFMIAAAVGALITGVAVAIKERSETQELPVNSVEQISPSNEPPLDWTDDGISLGYSNDSKDVMNQYVSKDVFPTLSPTALIKVSRALEPTAAPSADMTSKPTVKESRSPTQSPSTPSPTPIPTTPKPTGPSATPVPSSAPTKPRPSTVFPSQSPTLIASSIPSVTATTNMPTTQMPSLAPSQFPSAVVNTWHQTNSSPPSELGFEMEETTDINATNTTGSDDGNIGQIGTNTTGSDNGDIDLKDTNRTGIGNADIGQNDTNATGSDHGDAGQNSTNTTGEEDATMNEYDITQDYWRDQVSVAATDDTAPLNWSE